MKTQHVAQLAGPALAALTWWTATQWGVPDDMVRVLSAAAWMLVWWVAEAVPLGVTSVLPLVLFPTLGVADVSATASRGDRLLSGAHIICLGQWWDGTGSVGNEELSLLKGITRVAVSQLTGGRVMRTREVFKDLKSLGKGA